MRRIRSVPMGAALGLLCGGLLCACTVVPAQPAQQPSPTASVAARPTTIALATPLPTQQPAVPVTPRPRAPSRGRGAPPTPPPASSGSEAALPEPVPRLPLDPRDFPRGRYHLVQQGETGSSVAADYDLASKWVVYDANPILVEPDELPAGVWLYLPHPSLMPAHRPRPGEEGWSATPSNNAIVDQVWIDLAACESSGNWGIASGNGYYGGLQFKLSSWRLVGGRGWPHLAHPLEQIARADALQRIQGWTAWPVCSVKLGLRVPDPTPSTRPPPPS